MLRYLAKWFGLMIAELVLQFGVFAHRSDVLFVVMIEIFYWTLMLGLWGLVAKIGMKFAGKAVRKGVRATVREKRLAEQEALIDLLENSQDKRAVLKAYLKRHPSVPIRVR